MENTTVDREWEASSTGISTTHGTSFHNRSFVIPPFSTFMPLSRDERDCRRSVKTRPTTPIVAFHGKSFLFRILEVLVQASAKRWGTHTDDFLSVSSVLQADYGIFLTLGEGNLLVRFNSLFISDFTM